MINEIKKHEPFWDGWIVEEKIGDGSYGEAYKITKNEFGIEKQAVLRHIKVPHSQTSVKNKMSSSNMTQKEVENHFKAVTEEVLNSIMEISKIDDSRIAPYLDRKVVKAEDAIRWDIFLRMDKYTNLTDYVKENGITDKFAIKMGVELCKLFEKCNTGNLVHCNVKPENIFIDDKGNFYLGDFAIASSSIKTVGPSKLGNMLFMAPEIYRNEPFLPNVDTYSLGLVLYRLFNNNRDPFMPAYPAPIDQNDVEMSRLARFRNEEIVPPVNAQGRIAEIILKAISYDTAARYKSPVLMRIELNQLYERLTEEKYIISKDQKIITAEEISEVVPDFSDMEPDQSSVEESYGEVSADTLDDVSEEYDEMAFDVSALSDDSTEEYDELTPEEFDELVPDEYDELTPDEFEELADYDEYVPEEPEVKQEEPTSQKLKPMPVTEFTTHITPVSDTTEALTNEETVTEVSEPETTEQTTDEEATKEENTNKKPKRKGFSLFGRRKKATDAPDYEEDNDENDNNNSGSVVTSQNIWEEKYGSSSSREKEDKNKNDPFGGGFKMGW